MTTIDARYRDATLPVDARVADLLARMTLREAGAVGLDLVVRAVPKRG